MKLCKRLLAGLSVLTATGVFLVVGALGASAHVTPDPATAPKGAADQVITFRVPNEMDNANTVKLTLQLPQDHPIADVEALAMPGWTDKIQTRHLTTPIKTDDGEVTDVASVITWTGGKIAPGQYGAFKILAMGLPTDTNQLVFKALQGYDNGKTVSWIETQPGAEHPAPVVQLTAALPEGETTTTVAAAPSATTVPATKTTVADSTSSSNGLGVAGIIVGAIGLVLAIVALIVARSRRTPPTAANDS